MTKQTKGALQILALADEAGITLAQRTIEEHLKKVSAAMQSRARWISPTKK